MASQKKNPPRMLAWDSESELPEEGGDYPVPSVEEAAKRHAKHLDETLNKRGQRTISVLDRQKCEIKSVNVSAHIETLTRYESSLIDWAE